MTDQSVESLIRQRRLFLLAMCSLGAIATAMIVLDDRPRLLGYFLATFSGFCTIAWARKLILPQEALLELPADLFRWFPPDGVLMQVRVPKNQDTANSVPVFSEPSPPKSGVWDRELDGE
jgi:hypothetical protein